MTQSSSKQRSPRNKTIRIEEAEVDNLKAKLCTINDDLKDSNKVVHDDLNSVLPKLQEQSFDLLIADPPYNLSKTFGGNEFKKRSDVEYGDWLDQWLSKTVRLLKPEASIYICGDWRSSAAIERIGSKYFKPRNRITWEREKGRGARANWKNSSEDIWFFTVGDSYTFNKDDVQLKRKVVAPYRQDGKPKDWDEEESGNFRLTAPSNLWTDLTVAFLVDVREY